jgi:hypothetical protein
MGEEVQEPDSAGYDVKWGGDGITKTCESCHPDAAAKINHPGTTGPLRGGWPEAS